MKKFLILIGMIFVVFVAVMNLLSSYLHPLTVSTSLRREGVLYELKTDRLAYRRQQPIQVRLLVKNEGGTPIVFKFPTTQQYNFKVMKEYDFLFFRFNLDIWSSSYGRKYQQTATKLVIPPNETRIFSDVWSQRNAKGEFVPSGRYLIVAYLTTEGEKTELILRTKTSR